MTNENIFFDLGQVVATPAAIDFLKRSRQLPSQLLKRHQSGDFGDLCNEDRQANEEALNCGARIFSSYELNGEDKVWIITEADRSSTTILLPDEY